VRQKAAFDKNKGQRLPAFFNRNEGLMGNFIIKNWQI
jgi:hypothetical protein